MPSVARRVWHVCNSHLGTVSGAALVQFAGSCVSAARRVRTTRPGLIHLERQEAGGSALSCFRACRSPNQKIAMASSGPSSTAAITSALIATSLPAPSMAAVSTYAADRQIVRMHRSQVRTSRPITTVGLPGLWPMRKQRRRRIAAL